MATISAGIITSTAKNIQIPIQAAGIGDVIAISNSVDGSLLSHFIAIAGNTIQATAPSGYTWYGCVYARGMWGLLLRAFASQSLPFATTGAGGVAITLDPVNHANVIATRTTSWGLCRNGGNGTYLCLNVDRCVELNKNTTGVTNLHPLTGYAGGSIPPMGLASFNLNTNGAKDMYGTYENYMAQACPVRNTGPFQFSCGKENTKELALYPSIDSTPFIFTAAVYCYNYRVASEGDNRWWLSDMREIEAQMCANSYRRTSTVHTALGGHLSSAGNRWSSVLYGSASAWYYDSYGFSTLTNFWYGLGVSPVTLLQLK
jgi:hypothetical protein